MSGERGKFPFWQFRKFIHLIVGNFRWAMLIKAHQTDCILKATQTRHRAKPREINNVVYINAAAILRLCLCVFSLK